MEDPNRQNHRRSKELEREEMHQFIASKEEAAEQDEERLLNNLEKYNEKVFEDKLIQVKDAENYTIDIIQETKKIEEEVLGKQEDQLDYVKAVPRSSADILHTWINAKKGKKCVICSKQGSPLMKCGVCNTYAHSACIADNKDTLKCRPSYFSLWYTDDPESTPLIAFVNARSGGQQGTTVFKQLKSILGESQVFDLGDGGPTKGLLMYKSVPNLRIIVAGGDGSVGWVLTYLDNLKFTTFPPISILPLGTGNDLARSLKWGGGYSGEAILPILLKTIKAQTIPLDRWSVNIQRINESKVVIMNNYFSVGCDAAVALDFHTLRNSKPGLFKSRVGNKLWYGIFGAEEAVRFSSPVRKLITLEVDNVEIPIPKNISGIVVLNLSSYSAGMDLWGNVSKRQSKRGIKPQSFSDGFMEICGIRNTMQMGAVFVGISKVKKLAQGNSLKVTCKKPVPVQVDGEPWREDCCTIQISFLNQANMMYNAPLSTK